MKNLMVALVLVLSGVLLGIGFISAEEKAGAAIPDKFIGTYVEKGDDGKVLHEMIIGKNKIEWIRQSKWAQEGEDKDLITDYTLEANGEIISFDSKVAYARSVFGGQVSEGDVKVKMKVTGNTLNIEIGEMQAQGVGGPIVTMPPKKHQYTKQ
jgi:hypothetical protein